MNSKSISVGNIGRNDITPLLIGPDFPTRIVANIGLSHGVSSTEEELEKARFALTVGADIIADHTITPDVEKMLRQLVSVVKVPIATVPYYAVATKAFNEKGAIVKVQVKDILATIETQAKIGIDIMTLHASLTREVLSLLKETPRVIKIASRGGAWIAAYMIHKNAENPLYENMDEILDIMKSYGVTLSLGPSARPGSIVDGLDEAVIREINIQGQIVERALGKGVQTIVEYGGHFRVDTIPTLVKMVKTICHQAPLRTLITSTDVAASFDHIAAAIAATVAAINSADILVAISPAEHLGLPTLQEFVEGISAFKVAAHVADIVKHNDLEQDRLMSVARKSRDWESMWKYAIHGERAKDLHSRLQRGLMESDQCTMCGPLCAHKIVDTFLK